MQKRIKREDEILDPNLRKQILDEIRGPENSRRKYEAYKAHQVYRDQSYRFVLEDLLKQFDMQTVREMSYALSNISISRKVVDKLARVYAYGAEREISGDDLATNALQTLAVELDANTQMKQANRFLKLHKNTALYIKPYPVVQKDGSEKFNIKMEVLAPYFYDVVENHYDRTKPMVWIMSDYRPDDGLSYSAAPAAEGRTANTSSVSTAKGDGIDQTIADSPDDSGYDRQLREQRYIWWSDSFHFTTDGVGDIVSGSGEAGQDLENPFGKAPVINFAIDQDGEFWAQGGADLTKGSILINSMITNVLHVGIVQGYGQFYAIGKKLPHNIKVGPTQAIILDQGEDDPKPEIGFVSANPQLSELKELIEFYAALLISTNNLSTSGFKTSLEGGTSFPSGIAVMLDKAESIEDVDDQRQIFVDKEPLIWDAIRRQLDYYNDDLVEELKGLVIPEGFDLSLRFKENQSITSEADRLANMEKRKELGIASMIDLIKADNPGITTEQAEERLQRILEEKIRFTASALVAAGTNDQDNESDSEQEQDSERD